MTLASQIKEAMELARELLAAIRELTTELREHRGIHIR